MWGSGVGNGNPLQYSCLENPHGEMSLEGYNPWGHRVQHDWTCTQWNEEGLIKKKKGDQSNFMQHFIHQINLVQFSSVAQSCPTLCDPAACQPLCPSPTPGVYPNLCPLSQWCIQIAHPLLSPSPPAFNLSQHQGLIKWVSSLNQVAKVLEFQLQHQSFQWIFRTDFL